MPTVRIYHHGRHFEDKEFIKNFYVLQQKDPNLLMWEADGEALSGAGGGIHVWIKAASYDPTIHCVLSTWQLTIDSVVMERGYYENIPVAGRKIALLFEPYCFVCSFAGHPTLDLSDIRPL
jgi:hypothetical protein